MINTNYMNIFKFDSLSCLLFFVINISCAQDFINDIYQSVNTNQSAYVNDTSEELILSDSITYEDYEMNYENRIRRFHNPNYHFMYRGNYGGHDTYRNNWYYPSWSLSYNSWDWGYNW